MIKKLEEKSVFLPLCSRARGGGTLTLVVKTFFICVFTKKIIQFLMQKKCLPENVNVFHAHKTVRLTKNFMIWFEKSANFTDFRDFFSIEVIPYLLPSLIHKNPSSVQIYRYLSSFCNCTNMPCFKKKKKKSSILYG